MFINNGNVLGGVGASTAVTVGNISAKDKNNDGGLLNAVFNGNTATIIHGNVNVGVSNGANVAGFATGGLAAALGGTAISTVNGDTLLNINSDVNLLNATDGVTSGISGGGAAISTLGGTATSEVTGSTSIAVNNGLSIGIIGGGVAGAVDATGAVEAIKGGQIGNDDGSSAFGILIDNGIKFEPDENADNVFVQVKIDDAIEGGSATATTGDTNINLTGNTTAIGVIGGGVAASTHTYTWKGDGTADGEHAVNDAYGSSKATANTGKATIVVNLDSQAPDNVAANIGGGVAFGHGSYRSFIGSEDVGAYSVANNEDGADIYLLNGYQPVYSEAAQPGRSTMLKQKRTQALSIRMLAKI